MKPVGAQRTPATVWLFIDPLAGISRLTFFKPGIRRIGMSFCELPSHAKGVFSKSLAKGVSPFVFLLNAG